MMPGGTTLWVTLIAVVSGVLFHVSYDAQALDDELHRMNRQILAEQETIRVLRAEWTYLTRPSRLRALAGQLQGLEPVQGTQMVASVSTIPMAPLPAGDEGPTTPMVMVRAPGLQALPLPPHRPGSAVPAVDTPVLVAAAVAPVVTRAVPTPVPAAAPAASAAPVSGDAVPNVVSADAIGAANASAGAGSASAPAPRLHPAAVAPPPPSPVRTAAAASPPPRPASAAPQRRTGGAADRPSPESRPASSSSPRRPARDDPIAMLLINLGGSPAGGRSR